MSKVFLFKSKPGKMSREKSPTPKERRTNQEIDQEYANICKDDF